MQTSITVRQSHPFAAPAPAATFTFTFPAYPTVLPISPPAPHRKAPQPPTYSPRRRRARHIRMREPAQCGLFTVSEIPEDETMVLDNGSTFSTPVKRRSLTAMETPEDVEDDGSLNRLSWSSSVTDTEGMVTPHLESEDPFGWETIPLGGDVKMEERNNNDTTSDDPFFLPEIKIDSTSHLTKSTRPRRPPPLTLSTKFLTTLPSLSTPLSSNPASATTTSPADSECLITPRSLATPTDATLLPSLPIVSGNEWMMSCMMTDLASPTTPTRPSSKKYQSVSKSTFNKLPSVPSSSSSHVRRHSPRSHVDLASAFEDLLNSCGEHVEESYFSSDSEIETEDDFEAKSLRFPTPPSHKPRSGAGKTAPLRFGVPRTPESQKNKSSTTNIVAPFAPRKLSRKEVQLQSQGKRNSEQRERYRGSSPTLKGDHSFLTGLSGMPSPHSSTRSVTSSSSSSSHSSSSGRSLPERKGIPLEWTRFAGQKI
ncbi:hypothetical protein CI109_106071 [Kwoniella shandongensis]|uniref:Uncharacterized protein n=1 Tax=Kwoniella shandongensis TaxID=1734106 RepID=A0A5M6BTD2_9TREE|nr:uncharacterized protein CI109_006391 [Kwoniella shandongensis]KAA5525320.1 hypothetical protein CI109_006391 [Kwoniella shandongensis]